MATVNKHPPLFKHQQASLRKHKRSPIIFDFSDPGTGKTAVALKAWERYWQGRLLVVAVRSSMEVVWKDEAAIWTPDASVGIADAAHRREGFDRGHDVVVINTDGVKWIAENRPGTLLKGFSALVVDESAYFMHRTSARSRALLSLRKHFEFCTLLSGTPNPNSVLDLWHQMMVLDGGKRLGNHYFRFRNIVAESVQVGPRREMVRWVDKPGAIEAVYGLIKDISLRHELDKCMDIPEMSYHHLRYRMPEKLRAQYERLRAHAILQLKRDEVVGVHAASLRNKLLQLLSGAVYTTEHRHELVDEGRYELIADLIAERPQSIVFFQWRHQRELLMKILQARKLPAVFIDGTVGDRQRSEAVRALREGKVRTLLMHPDTGAHALTLIEATSVIWASPTYRPDRFKQGNRRVRRGGQTKKTECIMVEALNSVEALVYARLREKDARMMDLLDLLAEE